MSYSPDAVPGRTSWVQRISERLTRRLNRRLLAWFLLISIVPLMAASVFGYGRSSTIMAELAQRFLVAYASLEAEHVGDRIEKGLRALHEVATGNEVLSSAAERGRAAIDGPVLQGYLVELRSELKLFDALALFTADGAVVAATETSDHRPVRASRPARIAFAEFAAGAEGTPPVLRLVTPVFGSDTIPVGYLVATVLRTETAAFLELPSYQDSRIEGIIIDAERQTLVTSPTLDFLRGDRVLSHPLVGAAAGAVTGYHDLLGRERIAAIADVPHSSWRFIAEVSATDALRPLRRLGSVSLLMVLLFSSALVAAAVMVAREIVDPVRRLAIAARRVAAGDLSVRLPVRGHDEVAELGHAFNDMTAELADATGRVREMHQREIERASQLATVGELASGLAHEIKNPVIGITNGLDLVRRQLAGNTSLEPIMEEMARQLARIDTTVHDLLAFARPAAPQFGRLIANEVIARAVRLIIPAAERAQVHIETLPDPQGPHFQGDEGLVHQALVNVLMNALQATPAGGTIRLVARPDADHLAFEVSDTGRGIPPESLPNIFRPFFTTRHTGTGLGLSITRGIVERHGGTVMVQSTVGVGTTITLRFPVRPEPVATTAEELPE